MNIFKSVFLKTLNSNLLRAPWVFTCPRRSLSVSNRLADSLDVDLRDEDNYWQNLQSSLDTERNTMQKKKLKQQKRADKNVFVLQLKMQYKSKARQSTTAELQLAESISLIETLDNWKVIDSLIVSTKRSFSKEIFGSGNQEMLTKRISGSGADSLFIVIDRLTNLQVDTLRKTLIGQNSNIKIYDRYMIVLEIFKRNASSSIAKLQIALGMNQFTISI